MTLKMAKLSLSLGPRLGQTWYRWIAQMASFQMVFDLAQLPKLFGQVMAKGNMRQKRMTIYSLLPE